MNSPAFVITAELMIMRPYQHAVSSAAALGGRWQDYLAIHEFLDSTKAACSDMRHRMILHSVDFGGALTAMLFPDRDDIDRIVCQHVVEDIGAARTLSEWLQLCRRAQMPRFHPEALPIDAERMVVEETRRSGIRDDAYIRKICALLMLPMTFAPAFGRTVMSRICECIVAHIIKGPECCVYISLLKILIPVKHISARQVICEQLIFFIWKVKMIFPCNSMCELVR